MDIPNLSTTPNVNPINNDSLKIPKTPKLIYAIVIILAITSGFWISRFWPTKTASNQISSSESLVNNQAAQIAEGEQVKVGVLYGNTSKTFADSATGTVKAGGVNGEGTHTLEREGGKTQNAALTSSVIDLDLFIDKKVEVKGETNDSNKAGWLMDVGSIKILE